MRKLTPSRLSLPLAIVLAGVLTASASAQLVVGVGSGRSGEFNWFVDLGSVRTTNQYPQPVQIADNTPIFSPDPFYQNYVCWGMAADEPGRRLFFYEPLITNPPGGGLFVASYDNADAQGRLLPQRIGEIIYQGSSFLTGSAMAFKPDSANPQGGELYIWFNVGGVPGKGFYQVDLATAAATQTFILPAADETNWDVGAFDYDPVTDAFYIVNRDRDAPNGAGIYRVDLNAQTFTFISDVPRQFRNETDIDGMACGGGKAYLVTDEPGFVYVYNFITNEYEEPFLSPVTFDRSGNLGAAAFAPGLLPNFPTPTPGVATATPTSAAPTPTLADVATATPTVTPGAATVTPGDATATATATMPPDPNGGGACPCGVGSSGAVILLGLALGLIRLRRR